jgi:hypothetical protein
MAAIPNFLIGRFDDLMATLLGFFDPDFVSGLNPSEDLPFRAVSASA